MSSSSRVDTPSLVSVSSSEHLPGEFPSANESAGPAASSRLSLAQAVFARRAEYTKPRTARIKVGTWNVASFKGTEKDLGAWFVGGQGVSEALAGLSVATDEVGNELHADGRPVNGVLESFDDQEARYKRKQPTIPRNDHGAAHASDTADLYVLGLQEIVDINSAVEALRPFADASAPRKYKDALEKSLPRGFRLIAEQQLIGLLLLVYAGQELAPQIRSVSTTSVGTGLMGYMGNKGAVTARIVLGETTRLVFINSHMSAGVGKAELERRNWDAAQIVSRTRFEPTSDALTVFQEGEEKIGDEEYAFWFGDLNYRIEGIPADDVRRILMLHTQDEYAVGRSSGSKLEAKPAHDASGDSPLTTNTWRGNHDGTEGNEVFSTLEHPSDDLYSAGDDPTSLQSTLDSLLAHDELRQQQKAGCAFHDGWREGPITFMPTYKYDVGSVAAFDSGEKKRGPSWCDRILYRTKKSRLLSEEKVRTEQQSRKRDDQMKAQGMDRAAEDESNLFEYDPETDGDDEYDEGSMDSDMPSIIGSRDAEEDSIHVEHYISHQRVLSSDHKPLDCSFSLTYDAIDVGLKSKIQEQVARDIDRAENEGRPLVTMVVEGPSRDEDDPSFNGINFGHVRYDDPKTRFITIANTGQVPALFGFIDKSQDVPKQSSGGTPPRWLSLDFHYPSTKLVIESAGKHTETDEAGERWAEGISKIFTLDPGYTTSVELTSHVKDKTLVRHLNDGDELDLVLIMRVKNGREHFLPVKAAWKNSIQGRTIDRLIRIPEGGVRALQGEKPNISKGDDRSDEPLPVVWSAPREIFRLTEAIEVLVERITAEWSMLGPSADGTSKPPVATCAGWPFIEESWTLDAKSRRQLRVDVNEALDTDQSFDSTLSTRLSPLHRLEVFSDALLDFLENLEDGVLPLWLWTTLDAKFFAKAKANAKLPIDEKRAAILEILSLSPSHSISFVLLTSMLARVSQEVWSCVQSMQSETGAPAELPESPRVKLKSKALDRDRSLATKQLIQKNLAAVFAEVLVRTPDGSSKGQEMSKDHKCELVEIFLESSI